jgi:hypothetical protein
VLDITPLEVVTLAILEIPVILEIRVIPAMVKVHLRVMVVTQAVVVALEVYQHQEVHGKDFRSIPII